MPAVAAQRSRMIVFLICWLSLLADGYDLYVYGATLPAMIGQDPFNVTAAAAGTVGSLALVGMLLGSLVVGTLTDRLGRRRILISSVLLFSLFSLACAWAPTWELFALFRFIACFGVGGLLPTAVAMANEFAAPDKKSLTLGFVLTGPAAGTVVASLVALSMLETQGFRSVYAVGAAGLLLVPVAWRWLPESPAFLSAVGRTEEAVRISSSYGLPATDSVTAKPNAGKYSRSGIFSPNLRKTTLGIWAITLLSLLTMFGVSTWLPQIMRTAGYGIGSSVAFLLAYSLGAMVGTILASFASQKFGTKPLVVLGFGTAAMALLLMSLNLPTPVTMLLVALTGFGGMGTQNQINDYIAQYYPAGIRATGLGWALAIGRIGAIAGPTYGAVIIGLGVGIPGAALAFAIPALLGGLAMLFLPAVKPIRPAPPISNPLASEAGAR